MKNLMNLAIVLFTIALFTGSMFAQQGNGPQNLDGTGLNWVDLDGDGICDNVGTGLAGSGDAIGKMNKGQNTGTGDGLGDGNGFGDGSGINPLDGTGFGKKNGLIDPDGGVMVLKDGSRVTK